jgi:hypothetical protein
MRASKPSRIDRCGRRCVWPWPDSGADAALRKRRLALRAGLMLPPRSDLRTPLQALLRTRCTNAYSILARAHCTPVMIVVLRPLPVLH